ncbi:hypothetical protein GWI33_001142 [Rhynchophorus ferrugineus]|uniref:Uncharacterized protein n=1 Tax=Rhynchophorus ferrugineus TaxID=354439 RepID=A0A834ILK5_RHYFE|nr:hypothetical protein GWI33_001142 [Rhynchophorus ferrugineus]
MDVPVRVRPGSSSLGNYECRLRNPNHLLDVIWIHAEELFDHASAIYQADRAWQKKESPTENTTCCTTVALSDGRKTVRDGRAGQGGGGGRPKSDQITRSIKSVRLTGTQVWKGWRNAPEKTPEHLCGPGELF